MKDALSEILSIDLVQYAHSQGYTEKIRAKSSVNWTALKNPVTNDKIRIKQSDPMLYQNQDPGLDKDRGNVINFCINRLQGSVIPIFPPEKKNYAEAFKILKKYTGQVVPEPVFLETRGNSDKVLNKNKIKNLRPITGNTSMYLLEKRGIDPNLLHHPMFKGTIMEAPVVMQNDKVIFNTAFLKTDIDNKILGYVAHFYSSKQKQNLKRVFQLRPGLYKSNPIGVVDNLYLCETAIDAISHFQIHRPEKAMYASFGGQITPEEIQEIDVLLKKTGPQTRIVSITDNDYSGSQYDFKIALGLYNLRKPQDPIEYHQFENTQKIIIHKNNAIDIESLKKDMGNILLTEIQPTSEQHLLSYLQAVSTKTATIIEWPRSRSRAHHLFLEPLTKQIHKLNGIEYQTNKPVLKDWNDHILSLKKK